MRKFYRKDAGQSLTIRYSLAGRVDYRTFHAFTTWSNLRNGDQFPVTIRFYEMQAEAEAVQRILQSVHNSNIANVLELDVDYQNGYTAIIFEKFKSSFNNWLNVGLNIWEYNSDSTLVISMTNEFLIPFKGIIDGIRALHYKGLYHGNLINGVTVSSSGTIKLVNFNHEQDDFEQGMKKDLDDLKVLVWQVVEKYPTQDGSEDTPVVLSLFFQLEYECRDLRIDGGLSRHGSTLLVHILGCSSLMEHEKHLTPVQELRGSAWMIRDQNLRQSALVVKPLPSPLAAEAKACLEVICRARDQGIKC